MSQISPPIRILLVLSVAVLGAYMFFLRPKPVEAPPVDPAVTTQPGQVVPATEDTVDAGEAAARTGSATKESRAAGEAAAAAAAEREDLAGLPKPIRRAIRQDKVLVVLFSNGRSYDDKAVEKALTKVNRWDGGVFVHTAPIKRISRYGRIARGVSVEQSPTVVVADRDLRAQTLVGYVDRLTIDQAVVDARQNSQGLYTDSYLKQVDKVCFAHSNRWDSAPFYYMPGPRKADRRLTEIDAVLVSFVADFKALDAPKKHRAFHKAALADLVAYKTVIHEMSVAVTPKMKSAAYNAEFAAATTKAATLEKRINRQFRSENLPRCGSQF